MSSRASRRQGGFEWGLNDGILGLIAWAMFLSFIVVWTAQSPSVEKTDFSLTYVGAKIVHDGMAQNLYDINLQQALRSSLFRHPSPLLFEHPPFEALLLSPLGALPYSTAFMIWGFFNAALLWLLTLLLRSYLPWPKEHLAYIFLWGLFAPVIVCLYQGQSSLLLLGGYCLAYVLLKSQKDFLAGIGFGLGLFKFQFVVPFVLIFLLRRRWRFLCGFTLSCLIFAVPSVITVGPGGIWRYIRFLLAIGSNPQNESYGSAVDMPTIHGLIYAMIGTVANQRLLGAIVLLSSFAVLAWIAWRWRDDNQGSFDAMMAATVTASLISGSHMFTHDFSPLALAMFLVGSRISNLGSDAASALRIALRILLIILWAFPVYFVLVARHCLFLMCPVLLLLIYCSVRMAETLQERQFSAPELAPTGY